jgi:hypothetical protein
MASVIVGEMREGKGSLKKGSNLTLTYSSTFNFLVVTDDKNTSREEVLLYTPGLPVVGVVYGLIQATCTGIDADRRKDDPIYWDVVCTFDTAAEQQKQDPEDPDNPDPTTWLPVFIVDSFETRDKVLKMDFSPTPKKCVNSAGTPFADPITDTETICCFSFAQFENADLGLKAIMDRNGTTNQTAITSNGETFDARTLKLNVTGAEKGLFFMQFPAWRIQYRCAYDPETWDEKRLDVGPVQISGGKRVSCMDQERMYKIVGNLNGSGVQTFSDPSELTFRPKKQLEFNSFIRTS